MTIYKRKIKDLWVKMNKYSSYEYTVTIGCRTLADVDTEAEAYRIYNSVNQATVDYLF